MIPAEYFWINILLLALGTYAVRFSIISISTRVKISNRLKELFSFIPAAVLPALVTPLVFFHQGEVGWAQGKERFLVLIAATVVCYFTRNMLLTICFGLVALYLLKYLTL